MPASGNFVYGKDEIVAFHSLSVKCDRNTFFELYGNLFRCVRRLFRRDGPLIDVVWRVEGRVFKSSSLDAPAPAVLVDRIGFVLYNRHSLKNGSVTAYEPLFAALTAFINKTQERVSGKVDMKLYKGKATVTGRSSPDALYSGDLVSFESKTIDQKDSIGFSSFFGFQARIWKNLKK